MGVKGGRQVNVCNLLFNRSNLTATQSMAAAAPQEHCCLHNGMHITPNRIVSTAAEEKLEPET